MVLVVGEMVKTWSERGFVRKSLLARMYSCCIFFGKMGEDVAYLFGPPALSQLTPSSISSPLILKRIDVTYCIRIAAPDVRYWLSSGTCGPEMWQPRNSNGTPSTSWFLPPPRATENPATKAASKEHVDLKRAQPETTSAMDAGVQMAPCLLLVSETDVVLLEVV
jgi:hypothetical protein